MNLFLRMTSPRGARFAAKRGFTLTELLVVTAVIGILSALLTPVISKAMESGRQSKCVSNLRQIGAALQLYANDHNGLIAPALNVGDDGLPNSTWVTSLTPYIFGQEKDLENRRRAENVFACPESTNLTDNGEKSDYGINAHINIIQIPEPVPGQQANFRLASLKAPAKTIAVGDSGIPHDRMIRCIAASSWGPDYALTPRHGHKANVLYFDFHVATVDPTTLPASAAAETWAPTY